MTSTPPVAIIGAGLGGLMAARVLYTRGIPAVVYDLDASVGARDQGGTLEVHAGGGQIALDDAGLLDDFDRISRPEGEELTILDSGGAVRLHIRSQDADGQRPEVDRAALRDLLLSSLPHGTVRWNSKLSGARRVDKGSGSWKLHFTDGSTQAADVLVGADGTWSKVRQYLTDVQPAYSGVHFIDAQLVDVDRRHPTVASLVGNGSLFALAEGQGLIAQRNGDGSIRLYIALTVPCDWIAYNDLDCDDPATVRAQLVDLFPGWDRNLLALITEADGPLRARPIVALPTDLHWERVRGITLLGDAAHVMSPFAGQGANLAMLDGARLGGFIADHLGDLEAGLRAYEADMFARTRPAAEKSARNLVSAFAPGTPQGMVEAMRPAGAGGNEVSRSA